ncbi:MAG: hypothetical protein J6V92_08770 [Bacteroidaceae bacterium]|nr:hypothetical protein [Bacteroidaceae bacterium]
MEEIRIYHSPWRMLLLALVCFVFVALSILMLNNPKNGFHVLVAWLGIAFFGMGGLFMLYATLRERLTGKPFLTITDTCIIYLGVKQTVINFADVKSFEVVKMKDQKFVAIHYKPNVEQQKMDKASSVGRGIRSLNRRLVNAQENISTTGTGMKAEELCDLLNERLGS